MTDRLRVDPEALSCAGDEVADHGESLGVLHQSCHDEAQEAHSEWVGVSARALSELLDNWTAISTSQIARIGRHSCDMHSAAAEFVFMEERSAAALHPGAAAASPAGL